MAYNLSRMTVYALMCSLEEDLRTIIKEHIGLLDYTDSKFDQPLMHRAKDRFEKDLRLNYEASELSGLIDYFDLGDTYQTVNSLPAYFPEHIYKSIKSKTKNFEKMVLIRNRVMHIRPLDFDDLPITIDFCNNLVSEMPEIWKNVSDTIERLANEPSFVLNLEIKKVEEEQKIAHNLPLPDFDETGLIGRDTQVKQLKQLCYGSFPVISIVGEGGVGKSALALKVAYELLEEKDNAFDAVLWVSSKTTQITAHEIREIKGAILNSIGILKEVSNQLGGSSSEDPIKEVIEYLSMFKIALFIDNLETILDAKIREFIESLPLGSKVIITSRIGLGAYEYPIKLNGIEEGYASQLLRMLAKTRNISSIARAEEGTLKKYCRRMHLNPGYIKWFVSAVQTGLTPEAVLQNSNLFLDFCMSNVYNYLSDDAKSVTATMLCAPGWKDITELSHLTEFEAIRIQKALQELLATNMLSEFSKSLGTSIKTTYQLAELARAYLNKYHRPSNSFQEKVKRNRNRLNAIYENQDPNKNLDIYRKGYIKIRAKTDLLIAKLLHDSLESITLGKYDLAFEKLEEAKRLSPDYFEVARVTAYFHSKNGNYPEARDCYELAITLAPNTPQLHYWYALFLFRDEDSIDEAISQLEIAHKLDKNSMDVGLYLARLLMFRGRHEDTRALLQLYRDKIETAVYYLRQVFLDTEVQLHYREADQHAHSGDVRSSLESLHKMKEEFEKVPSNFKDVYLRNKLKKSFQILQRLHRICDHTSISPLNEFEKWLQKETVPSGK